MGPSELVERAGENKKRKERKNGKERRSIREKTKQSLKLFFLLIQKSLDLWTSKTKRGFEEVEWKFYGKRSQVGWGRCKSQSKSKQSVWLPLYNGSESHRRCLRGTAQFQPNGKDLEAHAFWTWDLCVVSGFHFFFINNLFSYFLIFLLFY